MEIAVKTTLFLGLNPSSKSVIHKQMRDAAFIPNFSYRIASPSCPMRHRSQEHWGRGNIMCFRPLCAVATEGVSSSQFEDFSVVSNTNEAGELKITIEVSGAKTRAIFDNVFNKMVAAAQPIPGFRRVKGGKTPDIPRDVLLEILGPSKVYKQVIKKVINSTVAEYVQKEGLKVSKDLRIEQSFEDLEEAFEPGNIFCFNAVVQIQESP
uniref:peptidylprolyl isomerase n=2 Tax=Rhizophora mucronata TaxID=61149 RepID=A0A2P2KST6_RHIMU